MIVGPEVRCRASSSPNRTNSSRRFRGRSGDGFRPLLSPYLRASAGDPPRHRRHRDVPGGTSGARAGVLLVPNHCRPCDPMVVTVLAGEVPTPIYMMASWHLFMGGRFRAWLLRRVGAFSVYREGLDRTAIKAAIELLAEALCPLVVFPEGIVTRANDRLAALNEGAGFIARSAAKQCAKAEPSARTLLVPVALRYRFLGRLEEVVCAGPRPDRDPARYLDAPAGAAAHRAAEADRRRDPRPQGARARRRGPRGHDPRAAGAADRRHPRPPRGGVGRQEREGDAPSRARASCAAILPDLVDGGLTDGERDCRRRQLALLYLCSSPSLYPAGYLEGSPSPERILETVERLEEDLTYVATVHRPLAVTIRVGEPVEVGGGRLVAGGAHEGSPHTHSRRCWESTAGTHQGRDGPRGRSLMNGEPAGMPRRTERVRTIVLRVLAVAAGLGLWFWTQSLIGARGFPAGCVWDGLHQLTAGVNSLARRRAVARLRCAPDRRARWSSTSWGSSCSRRASSGARSGRSWDCWPSSRSARPRRPCRRCRRPRR